MCYDLHMNNGAAKRFDHIINIGEEYELRTLITDDGVLDLTGYTASFKARAEFDSGTVLFDLLSSTSPTYITMDDAGNLNVDIPASDTSAYTAGSYKFTINIWPTASPDNVRRVLEGEIEVRPQVVTS